MRKDGHESNRNFIQLLYLKGEDDLCSLREEECIILKLTGLANVDMAQVKGIEFLQPAVSQRNTHNANCVEVFHISHSGNSWWCLVLVLR